MKLVKKLTIIFLLVSSLIVLYNFTNKTEDANPIYKQYELMSVEGRYSAFINEHQNDHVITETSYQVQYDEFELETGETTSESYYDWETASSITTNVSVGVEGLYLVYFDYASITETHMPVTLEMLVNGQKQYEECTNIILNTLWSDEGEELDVDRYGNDVNNEQMVYEEFRKKPLRDAERLYDDGLYVYLNSGENEITFKKNTGHIKVKSIFIESQPQYQTYNDYLNLYKNVPIVESTMLKIQAEDPYYKNSSTIVRGVNKDPLVEPFSLTKMKLNVLGTDTYNQPGDAVTWKPDITEPGLYNLTFKVKQMTNYRTMYRTLYINDEIPYKEAKHLVFEYQPDWNNVTIKGFEEESMMVYLEPGDTVSLEVDGTLFNSTIVKMQSLSSELSQLGLDITKLTKNNADRGIDWDIPAYFPNVENDLDRWIYEIKEINGSLRSLFGYKKDAQIIKDLEASIIKLESIQNDINQLPRMLSVLSTGSSSALQLISNQIDTLRTQSMLVDALYIHTEDVDLPNPNSTVWKSSLIGIKRFFLSFIDPSYSEKADEDELEVWVNRSRQYADIIQQFADKKFTKETGIKVKVSIIKDDGKLLLANSANQQPDIAMGVSAWIPNEYGMRGMLYDMREADNYLDTVSLYNSEQLIPMVYDNGLYGLPETENFYVLYYRKDIVVDQLGLEVPSTWEDVINLLPVLNRYGMDFYIPLSSSSAFKSFDSTAPFIYQFGGDIYEENGFSSAIDGEKSVEALEFMTDLYREYGTPVQISSFFNGFRYGNVPIGIGDFGMYLQLTNAAADIRGLWDMALVPGMPSVNDNNETVINRSMPGAQQTSIIFEKSEKKEESWEFLSWWMSTETQVEYSETLLNTLGTRYIWNSANMEAFSNLRVNEEHKSVILSQWEHLKEIQKIPGSYIVEREISNIWNNVVYNDANIRSSISDATIKINKEIIRKMKEFDYIDSQGNILREFNLPTKEDIERWFEGG